MGIWISLVSFIAIIVSGISLIIALFKKQPKKQWGLILLGSVILFFAGAILSPKSITLSVISSEIETDETGKALIEGEASEDAVLTINGETVKNNKGSFSYTVQLTNEDEQQYVVKASLDDQNKEKEVLVKPSNAFIAYLEAEKAEKELAKRVETALALAEKQPTQANYDEAATLIHSLSKTYDDYDQRLVVIHDHLEMSTALDKVEKSLSRNDLQAAEKLIATASLNKSELTDRFKSLQTKVEEKEQQEKLQAQAVKAVEKAEAEPTESNLTAATSAIAKLSSEDKALTQRTESVRQTIQQEQEKQQLAKAEAAKAEQERQAAAAAQQASQDNQSNQTTSNQAEERVLITRTGSKYHTHKCGNGTYFEATLSEALSKGLTPCKKCY
jgi:peptidyl-tRNA hydrolase